MKLYQKITNIKSESPTRNFFHEGLGCSGELGRSSPLVRARREELLPREVLLDEVGVLPGREIDNLAVVAAVVPDERTHVYAGGLDGRELLPPVVDATAEKLGHTRLHVGAGLVDKQSPPGAHMYFLRNVLTATTLSWRRLLEAISSNLTNIAYYWLKVNPK